MVDRSAHDNEGFRIKSYIDKWEALNTLKKIKHRQEESN